MKTIISTPAAPAAIGPYNQAVVSNGMLFTAGQIPLDPSTGELVSGSFQDRVHRVMANLAAILSEAGSDFSKVVKTNIYITDMGLFPELNAVYGEYFAAENAPARATVQVAALPLGTDVEIDVVATL